jgi:hypothetical protein
LSLRDSACRNCTISKAPVNVEYGPSSVPLRVMHLLIFCKAKCWNILYSTINFNLWLSNFYINLNTLSPGAWTINTFLLKYNFIPILIPKNLQNALTTCSKVFLVKLTIHSASQKIPHSLGNMKVHYVFSTAGPYPDLINPVHILFSFDPPSTPGSSNFPTKILYIFFKKLQIHIQTTHQKILKYHICAWKATLFWARIFPPPYTRNLKPRSSEKSRYPIEQCFPTFSPWKNPWYNFSYPEEPLPMKTFTGQKKLIVGRPIQLLLNYHHANLFGTGLTFLSPLVRWHCNNTKRTHTQYN